MFERIPEEGENEINEINAHFQCHLENAGVPTGVKQIGRREDKGRGEGERGEGGGEENRGVCLKVQLAYPKRYILLSVQKRHL